MGWGFPDPRDWRRPRPIHARSETIDAKEPFLTPFHAGQRGIVIFRTFNEGEEVVKPSGRTEPGNGRSTRRTASHAASPLSGSGLRFLICPRRCWLASWRRFLPTTSYAARSSPGGRPAYAGDLEDDAWSTWLGEAGATPAAAKSLLKTMGGRELAGSAGTKKSEAAQTLTGATRNQRADLAVDGLSAPASAVGSIEKSVGRHSAPLGSQYQRE